MNSLSKTIYQIKDAIMRELYPERYMVSHVVYKDESKSLVTSEYALPLVQEKSDPIPETRNAIPSTLDLSLHKNHNTVMYRIVNYHLEDDNTFTVIGEKNVNFYPTKIGMDCQLTKCDNGSFSPRLIMVGEKLDLSETNPKWTTVRIATAPW